MYVVQTGRSADSGKSIVRWCQRRSRNGGSIRTMSQASTQMGARQLENIGVFEELIDINNRLRSVEKELELMDDEQEAHLLAKKNDARDIIDRGEDKTVVIGTPPEKNDGRQAVSKIDGVVTFVDVGEFDLHRGDVARVRIFDVGKNHAEALALAKLEDTE